MGSDDKLKDPRNQPKFCLSFEKTEFEAFDEYFVKSEKKKIESKLTKNKN